MRYSNYGSPYPHYPRYERKPIKKDPGLAPRLDKILRENLNTDTRNFVVSLNDFFQNNGGLSEKQLASFMKIESRFSPMERLKLIGWEKEYRQDHLQESKILAQYYVKTPYKRDWHQSILDSAEFVPHRNLYMKMRNNKYAKIVLEETNRDPRFEDQSMIQIRSNVGTTYDSKPIRKFRNRLCFVINNNLPILNPVNGGKRYKVLPMGASSPILVEERWIMKPNKNGASK